MRMTAKQVLKELRFLEKDGLVKEIKPGVYARTKLGNQVVRYLDGKEAKTK